MALFLEQKKICCGSWLASVITGSAQVLEKYQTESPGSLRSRPWASSILQSSPSPAQHPLGGAHRRHVGSSSFTVHPALKSHPRSDAMLPREGLTAPMCFPRRARVAPPRALGYSAQALLVLVFQQAACPGEWESNRTSSFPVPPRCPRNTELGHKQLAKAGRATSMCHQKQGPTQGTGEPGKRCAGGGTAIARHAGPRGAHAKAKRSARGATQTAGSLPPTARHHHAPQRMSRWAEA